MRVGSGPGGRGRRTAAVLVGASMVAGAAACSGGEEDGPGAVRLTVSPAGGGGALKPDSPIAVQADGGTIANVTVATGGAAVEGALNEDRTRWRSRWTLEPGRTYTVDATALGADGKTESVKSRFQTAEVEQTNDVTFEAPDDKETVGVGMPIIMQFEHPVQDRAAVERALEVRADKPVEGAWSWREDDEVVFRTKGYWPTHTNVTFNAHLSGVRTGGDRYGGKNHSLAFKVGERQIATADQDSHKMDVEVNGKKVRTVPISMGKGGARKYVTTNGVHLAMSKEDPVTMTSSWMGVSPGSPGGYNLTVYKSVRLSDSGEYIHSAPWSVGSQGSANVSNGCINLSPSDAKWYFDLTQRGDPLVVTGTNRELEPDNGWGYWQVDWKDWVQGSALRKPVTTAPLKDASTVAADQDDQVPAGQGTEGN